MSMTSERLLEEQADLDLPVVSDQKLRRMKQCVV